MAGYAVPVRVRMTRQDYELIARTVFLMDLELKHKAHVALRLGQALAKDNPRFDMGRFVNACGGD